MKEPFRLANGLLWLENWMDLNSKLVSGFTTLEGGTLEGDFKGLNIAYHVGDDPKQVLSNRICVSEKIDIPLKNWVFAEQLHTTTIHKVTAGDLGSGVYDFESGISATDGLYTKDINVVLATFYADCTPLYFYAPNHQLIGVAHAGWRGTVNGIMHKMLQTLKEIEHIHPSEILVAIGPCIGRDAYRVDDTVINQVLKTDIPNITETFVDLGKGQYKFDPKLMNYKQALFEGIPSENILVSSYCTYTDKDLFYSHRRNPQSGRMMSFIALKE